MLQVVTELKVNARKTCFRACCKVCINAFRRRYGLMHANDIQEAIF